MSQEIAVGSGNAQHKEAKLLQLAGEKFRHHTTMCLGLLRQAGQEPTTQRNINLPVVPNLSIW
jgi:hypothetical protein